MRSPSFPIGRIKDETRQLGPPRYAGFFESNIDHPASVSWSGWNKRAVMHCCDCTSPRSQRRNYCLCNKATIYA
jgi:hypothetical protein